MYAIEQRAYESIVQISMAMKKQNELIAELVKELTAIKYEIKNFKEEDKDESK